MPDLFTLIRVADTETTGLKDPAELVEIGWTDVRLYPNGWQIDSGPHSHVVNAGLPVTPGARAAHHLTDEEIAKGIPPDTAREILTTGADYLAFHNTEFDVRFIRTRKPVICTMKVAKTLWPDLEGFGNQTIRYSLGLCLSPADRDKAMPPHRAGPDSWVTAHILIEELRLMTPGQMVYCSDQPVLQLKCPLKKHRGVPWSQVPLDYLDWILNRSEIPNDPDSADLIHTARHWYVKRTSSQ
jgi:exodeoxyribonuclease X